MKLSIIIPCFNENETINRIIESLLEIDFPIEREIIVVDDGSSIQQRSFIKKKISEANIKVLRFKTNQGKGSAIRLGLRNATGDVFIIQDADYEYDPKDIPKLLKPMLVKKTQVVYGSRFLSKKLVTSFFHNIGNKILTKLTNFLYHSNLTDMETGYKLFTKEISDGLNLKCTEFEFEPEITSKILKRGFKIVEIPISYHRRKFGKSKITIYDGIDALLVLIINRFFENSRIFSFLYSLYKEYFHKKRKLRNFTKN